MNGRESRQFASVEDCVEQTLARVGRKVVLCTPIGAGKPVALVNEFYRRAAADLPRADARSLVAAEIMGGIYFEILHRIEQRGYDVFPK